MKRKVDLTANRDFASSMMPVQFRTIYEHIAGKYPWSELRGTLITSEEEFFKSTIDSFYTGSVVEIRKMKNSHVAEEGLGLYCDCCGKRIKFNLSGSTLCKKCDEHMKDEYRYETWRRLPDIATNDWVIEQNFTKSRRW